MDKLKKVLSGQDGNNDDGDILQAANQASTLGWGTRMKGFIACFVLGVLFSILGTCFLWIPRSGLILFATCLVLTLCSAFWWKNNGLALLFCILQFLAFTWYGLSYIPFARDAVIKMFSLCLK
ncbi:hypothetical protein UPYG_G00021470 [Umbra pygmaea]|uniref:Vesicle transport protein n=1 Tax=Umbra pygmaea TaxID=75934 RepID=A0ABD0XZG8_UMBPY